MKDNVGYLYAGASILGVALSFLLFYMDILPQEAVWVLPALLLGGVFVYVGLKQDK